MIREAIAWFTQRWGNAAATLTGVALLITTGQALGIVSPAMPVLWYQFDAAQSAHDGIDRQRFAQQTIQILDLTDAFYSDLQTMLELHLAEQPGDANAIARKKEVDSKLGAIADQRRTAECDLQHAQSAGCL